MRPSLALLEIDGIARGYLAADALVKRAPVQLFAGEPVSPGKFLLFFGGGVAEVHEALLAGKAIAGDRLLDELYLPQAHEELWRGLAQDGWLRGGPPPPPREQAGSALAIVEAIGAAATLLAADAACKAAFVALGALHLARGIGGKGYFTLSGEQHDLEAALEAAARAVTAGALVETQLLASPHPELWGPVVPGSKGR